MPEDTIGVGEEVEKILQERGSAYGPSWRTATEAIAAMTENDASRLQGLMDSGLLANWVIIVSKVCRIIQTPEYKDSWLDLSGYAELSAKHIDEKVSAQIWKS